MKALFDLNVVLDVALERQPWLPDARALVVRVLDGTLDGFVSAASFPSLFYVAERTSDTRRAIRTVVLTLRTFGVVPVGRREVEAAAAMRGRDFEDNLMIAAAEAARIERIVTRNAGDFEASPIVVVSPTQLLAELESDRGSSG